MSSGTSGWNPEIVPDRFDSGGGFSDFFAAPAYQKQTTDAYVASLNGLHDGLYNAQGRGYPDVAAQSFGIAGIHQGYPAYGVGTSAAAPAFAAVIALVNDALLAQGLPVLGFLNPWLYGAASEALTDIVTGSTYGKSSLFGAVLVGAVADCFDYRLQNGRLPCTSWLGCSDGMGVAQVCEAGRSRRRKRRGPYEASRVRFAKAPLRLT